MSQFNHNLRQKTILDICGENHLPISISTNIVDEESSRNKVRATSSLIAKALIATLGPYGSTTIIQDREGHHFATKDGYDLLNRMDFDDAISKTVLDLFRMTASNQVFSVGDGSTSAIIVANALYQALTNTDQLEQFKCIAPKDIVDILNDLEGLLEKEIRNIAKPISPDMHELDIIAEVANNNDSEVGKLIGEIYRKIGEYGFITMDVVEKRDKDEYEIKSGIEWDRGYVDQVFPQTAGEERIILEEKPRIIISNSALTYDDLELVLIPLMKAGLKQENGELVIVANHFDQDVINFFKTNRTKHLGNYSAPEMNFVAVDIDQVTKESRNKLEDLALLCGCKIYDKFSTPKAEIVKDPKQFIGIAEKAIITPKTTQILKCETLEEVYKKKIDSKVKEIEIELSKLNSIEVPNKDEEYKIYELRQRKSRLTSSTAILHIGGKTLTERQTRQRLIEDSVFACKSAIKYGYIVGGNIVIPKILKDKKEAFASTLGLKYKYLPIENPRSFLRYFIEVIQDSFLESYHAVLSNSYIEESDINKIIKTCLDENKFYNIKTHSYEDWEETRIINSTDTDIEILRSCTSIIGLLSTSNQFALLNLDMSSLIRNDV